MDFLSPLMSLVERGGGEDDCLLPRGWRSVAPILNSNVQPRRPKKGQKRTAAHLGPRAKKLRVRVHRSTHIGRAHTSFLLSHDGVGHRGSQFHQNQIHHSRAIAKLGHPRASGWHKLPDYTISGTTVSVQTRARAYCGPGSRHQPTNTPRQRVAYAIHY